MPWYYYKRGSREGPIDDAVMRHMAALGEIEPTDLVWSPGMKEWAQAATVPGLLEPPPIPVSTQPEDERSGLGGPSVLPAPTAAFAPTLAPNAPQAEGEPHQAEPSGRHVTRETEPSQRFCEEEPTTPSVASRGTKCPKCAFLLPETAFLDENYRCPACDTLVDLALSRPSQVHRQAEAEHPVLEGSSILSAPAPQPVSATSQPAKKPLQTRWLSFYTYVRLPLGAVAFLVPSESGSRAYGYMNIVFACFIVLLAIGLAKRTAWAWGLNFVLLTFEAISLSYSKSLQEKESGFALFVVMLAVLGLCWLLPNGIYFWKRRDLFGVTAEA